MTRGRLTGFLLALLVHGVILTFGGLLFLREPAAIGREAQVELVAESAQDHEDEKKEEAAKEEQEPEEQSEEELAAESEQMPDVRDLARLEAPAQFAQLEALSLSDLEGALESGGAGGLFGEGFHLTSGGRIGGTGQGPGIDEAPEEILSAGELDQRPRAIFQPMPHYPLELRKRRVEGTVSIVFVVDKDGRVSNPKVEKSTDPAFERPALDAVKQWTFEAGTKNGEKVPFKMRVPITFNAG